MEYLEEPLLERLRTDPVGLLGRKSVFLLDPFFFGYETALAFHRACALASRLSPGAFQDWVEERHHWTKEMGCRQNVASFAALFSRDEGAAFDWYMEARALATRECGEQGPPAQGGTLTSSERRNLFELMASIRERPPMYFGNEFGLDALWAFFSGYFTSEADLGIGRSAERELMTGFQRWIEARYPFAAGRPWNRVLDFLSLHSRDRAWESFFDHLAMFESGDSPDALSPTAKQMLASISQAQGGKALPRELIDLAKRICPS